MLFVKSRDGLRDGQRDEQKDVFVVKSGEEETRPT